jgi:D-threo-aldose 1-dehydrogenase
LLARRSNTLVVAYFILTRALTAVNDYDNDAATWRPITLRAVAGIVQHRIRSIRSRRMNPSARQSMGPSKTWVTELGFGCGTLGDPDEVTSDEQAQAALQTGWDAGIRYFDTAPWYGNTKSEHRAGQFLRNQPRDAFVLSTKVGRVYSRPSAPAQFSQSEFASRWRGGLPFVLRFDYSASGIRRAYEDSLQRLGLNRVDFLVIHDLDPRHQKGEEGVHRGIEQLDSGGGFAELASLRARGEISAIGAGVNHIGMIPRLLERFDIDYFLVAMPYTLLDQEVLNGELQLCVERGVRVVIGAVFASGILATGATNNAQYRYQSVPPDVRAKVEHMQRLCAQHAITLSAAALQFPLAHPAVATVIPGANSPAQVRSNVAAFRTDIPPAFWSALREQGLIDADAPLP